MLRQAQEARPGYPSEEPCRWRAQAWQRQPTQQSHGGPTSSQDAKEAKELRVDWTGRHFEKEMDRSVHTAGPLPGQVDVGDYSGAGHRSDVGGAVAEDGLDLATGRTRNGHTTTVCWGHDTTDVPWDDHTHVNAIACTALMRWAGRHTRRRRARLMWQRGPVNVWKSERAVHFHSPPLPPSGTTSACSGGGPWCSSIRSR